MTRCFAGVIVNEVRKNFINYFPVYFYIRQIKYKYLVIHILSFNLWLKEEIFSFLFMLLAMIIVAPL